MINKAILFASILLAPLASVSALPASTKSASYGNPTPTPTSSTSVLPTYTSASVSISLISGAPQNTHISTVGLNGRPTSVPIIGGPECWVSIIPTYFFDSMISCTDMAYIVLSVGRRWRRQWMGNLGDGWSRCLCLSRPWLWWFPFTFGPYHN